MKVADGNSHRFPYAYSALICIQSSTTVVFGRRKDMLGGGFVLWARAVDPPVLERNSAAQSGRADGDPMNCGDRKPRADCLRRSRLGVAFVSCGSWRLWYGCDRNLNVSTLFEFHIIAMFVN
jgi:hypothetical protein